MTLGDIRPAGLRQSSRVEQKKQKTQEVGVEQPILVRLAAGLQRTGKLFSLLAKPLMPQLWLIVATLPSNTALVVGHGQPGLLSQWLDMAGDS